VATSENVDAQEKRTFSPLNRLSVAERSEMPGQHKGRRVKAAEACCERILRGAVSLTKDKHFADEDEIVDAYYERIYRGALSLTWDKDLAEEIVQETFVAALRKLESFSGRTSVFTWLYRIMLNKYRDHCRRKGLLRRLGFVRAEAHRSRTEIVKSGDASPAAELAISEERQLLKCAVDRLPEKLQIVVIMHYFNGMPLNEVAQVLNCRLGTVKSRLYSARRRLYQMLQAKLGF